MGPLDIERQIILAADHRRKYGARVVFQVRSAHNVGDIGHTILPQPSGQFIEWKPVNSGEPDYTAYAVEVLGFRRAAEAEDAGTRLAQGVLLAAISMDIGLRLLYSTHEIATVFDRTLSEGIRSSGSAVLGWQPNIVLDELTTALSHQVSDRKMLLSMELFASARLEANDSTRFVTAVSALEPLAERSRLGPEIDAFVKRAVADLTSDQSVSAMLKEQMRQRLLDLRRESIRQALFRLCGQWFPDDVDARDAVDHAYQLRSKILHEGQADSDVLLGEELRKITSYLRRIYAANFGLKLRAPAACG